MSGLLTVNEWTIYAHPLFLDQLESLIRQTEQARKRNPEDYRRKRCAKLLAAVARLAFEKIPEDPTRDIYFQGTSLGEDYKHWYRAKFFQQYRLYFRYHTARKIILYAWVNDEDTRRADGSATDAYSVFRRMLDSGNPPDDWNRLKAACDAAAIDRLNTAIDDAQSLI
jgi:toxin YhaV